MGVSDAPVAGGSPNAGRARENAVELNLNNTTYFLDRQQVMGVHIWPAAYSLATRIVRHLSPGPNSRAIELGAGGALPSLVAASHGFHVVATDDDPNTLKLIQRNIALNGLSHTDRIVVRPLNWSSKEHIEALRRETPELFQTVFGSDIMYSATDIYPLLKCATALLGQRPDARFLLAMTDHRFSQLHPTFEARATEFGLRLVDTETEVGAAVYKNAHLTTTGQERVRIYAYAWGSPEQQQNHELA